MLLTSIQQVAPFMSLASQFAPTGTLRVGVWTVPYFAHVHAGGLRGIIPDLGVELARRAGVKLDLVKFENPARITTAFRDGSLDATFVGITADRAEAIDFGPVVFEIQTTYLVPAASAIASIAEIDRAGVRIAVPAKSAQEAYLATTISAATLLPIPAETPRRAIELLQAGGADAFSHVAPMLAAVQGGLPGSRILRGSYFNVPVGIGVAKGRPRAVADFARIFAEDVTLSGFVQQSIDRNALAGVRVPT
ncbi:MAG: transporter substrate-binding domain-containing protein [Rhizobiales bacterium]|nr:transporter substrate-binding domain-containing protein [Hyphomicrobiales bacterium]